MLTILKNIMLVKKIIVDRVYLKNFGRTVYNSQVEVDIPYLAGTYQNLIPKVFESNSNADFIDRQYINDSFLFNETIQVGQNGLYYILLQKGYKIDKLLYEPSDLNIDLYIHKDGRLIYSFYNCTNKKNLIVKGKISEDYDNISKRLNANIDDILFRNYFIQLAIEDYTKEIKIPNFVPTIMDAKQVSVYLSVAEKTIRSWTSQKKIPFTKINQTVRYRRSDIDKWLTEHTSEVSKKK